MAINNNNKDSVIKRCIDYFLENSTNDEKIPIVITVEYYAVIELLNAYIQNKENIPENTKRKAILKAVDRYLKHKKYVKSRDPVKAFYEAYRIELNIMQKKRKCYFIVMFLNLDYRSATKFKDISLIHDSIEFISWERFSEFDVNSLWKQLEFERRSKIILSKTDDSFYPKTLTFTPIVLEISSYDIEAAIDFANEKIDLLRSFINASFSLLQYTIFRSEPKELSKILPTPFYAVFDEDKKFIKVYHTIEKYSYSNVKIPPNRMKFIDHLFDIYSNQKSDNDLYSYLISVLRQYQRALDMVHPETAYLAMWRVLEYSVSFGEEGIKNDQIKSRIKILINPNQYQKDVLTLVTDQRNSLVHSGIFPEKSDNIYFILKDIVDHIIYRLILLSYEFDSIIELRQYLRFAERGDTDLLRTKNVIEKILESRSD